MNTRTATITILAVACISTAANADVFTDSASFDAANPGLPLIDFEGLAAPGTFTGNANEFFSGQGVLFSTPNSPGSNTVVNGSGGDFGFPTSGLTSNAFAASIQMDFINPVTAVGFDVASMDFITSQPGSVTIEVFNGTTLLATESFVTSSFADFSSFIGFSNLGDITSVLATPVGSAFTQLAIDNLSLNAVPTPGSLAVMGLGLFCAGGRRRRS
jgi:hypothetical protein